MCCFKEIGELFLCVVCELVRDMRKLGKRKGMLFGQTLKEEIV